jgi:hypothetical protein
VSMLCGAVVVQHSLHRKRQNHLLFSSVHLQCSMAASTPCELRDEVHGI